MRKRILALFALVSTMAAYGATEYKLNNVQINGTKEIPKDVIRSYLTTDIGETYKNADILDDFKELKSLSYVDDLKIYPKVVSGGVTLVVDVKESSNAKQALKRDGIVPTSEKGLVDKSLIVRRVDVVGNKNTPASEIRSKIPVKVGQYYSSNKVQDALYKLNRSGEFVRVEREARKDPSGGTLVTFLVAEMPKVTSVGIRGNTVFSDAELMKELETKPGQTFNRNDGQDEMQAIVRKYADAGYTEVSIKPDESKLPRLEYIIDEGIIKEVEFKKMVTKKASGRRQANDTKLKTQDFILEREMQVKKGKPFNQKEFDAGVRSLMRQGHFKNVKHELRDLPSGGKKLVVLIDEDSTAMLQGSLSYGSAVGMVGSLSVKENHYKGRGQKVGVSFEKSSDDFMNASISYRDPWIKGTKYVSWGWRGYFQNESDSDSFKYYKTDRLGAELNIGKGLTKDFRYDLGLKVENAKHEDKTGKTSEKYTYVSLTPSVVYDTRNHFYDATEGIYAKAGVEVGTYVDGASGTFTKGTFDLRTYHKGFFKNNTMAYRLSGGVATESTKLPERFSAGGASSIRGYDFGYLRGNQKLVLNVENRTKINDTLGFVAFYDVGRAWDSDDAWYKDNGQKIHKAKFAEDIKHSVGVGARIKTPIGPLRLDFGRALGDKDVTGFEFYFNMGQMF